MTIWISPGTGRTGAVLAIDICLRQLDHTRAIDIPRCIYRLRQDRSGCVQTPEQYAFIYKVRLHEFWKVITSKLLLFYYFIKFFFQISYLLLPEFHEIIKHRLWALKRVTSFEENFRNIQKKKKKEYAPMTLVIDMIIGASGFFWPL